MTLLRAHHDQFSAESEHRLADADAKSQKFNTVQNHLDQKIQDVGELSKTNNFLEQKLSQSN
jgi:hypothetical protein